MTTDIKIEENFLARAKRYFWRQRESETPDYPRFIDPVSREQFTTKATSTSEDDLLRAELDYISKAKEAAEDDTTEIPSAEHISRIRGALDDPNEADPDDNYLFGLALSGGGIRSATFSLGVLQRLARAGLLKEVDYLSTVSGGGYIGAALSYWLSNRNGSHGHFGRNADDFPYGAGDPGEPRETTEILSSLRQNGKYLIPGHGITVWSGIAIVLRALFLNLFVWIPILTLLYMVLAGVNEAPAFKTTETLLKSFTQITWVRSVPGVYAFAALAAGVLFIFFLLASLLFSFLSWAARGDVNRRRPEPPENHREQTDQEPETKGLLNDLRFLCAAVFYGLIILVTIAFGVWIEVISERDITAIVGGLAHNIVWIFLLFAIGLGLFWVFRRDVTNPLKLLFAMSIPLVLTVADWVVLNFFPEVANGGANRIVIWFSVFLQLVAVIGLGLILIFWLAQGIEVIRRLPGISVRYSARRRFETQSGRMLQAILVLLVFASVPPVAHYLKSSEGAVSVLLGAASGFWGHLRSRNKDGNGSGTKLILLAGSILLLYGVLLVSYHLSNTFGMSAKLTIVLLALAVFAVISGWCANLNYISLHRFYRDRLMEAFLPDYRTVQSGESAPAGRADGLRLSSLWEGGASGPFHLINTNLVLVNSPDRTYRARGGDNFILSQLYCGSAATGWQQTKSYMQDEMTLPTAMAISGAAANPRSGGGGKGITRNRLFSLAMTFLNLRLGYYVPRPTKHPLFQKRPNHFRPGALYSIPWFGYRENSDFQELSDGGHFENLALYELVRRRCGLIVICDGGQDKEASYGDLIVALQRIGQDFGATISFDADFGGLPNNPRFLISKSQDQQDLEYPGNAQFSDKGYFVANIDYGGRGGGAWPKTGTIIYLKTAMVRKLKMEARGYKGAHPDFPDETTVDQFFNEEQFEAYRELGYRIADDMIGDLQLDQKFASRRPKLSTIARPSQKKGA